MQRAVRSDVWARVLRLRRQRRFQTAVTLGLVLLGPVLAVATFLALGPFNQGATSPFLRLILLSDLVYVLVIAALVLARVARMIADRRSQSAGSRLHLRLSGVFMLIALTPTVLVAVFAVLSVNIGLEGWFSERVRSVVGSSLAAAQAYEAEQRDDLTADAIALAAYINRAKERTSFLRDDQLRPLLTQGQAAIQRGLKEAYLVDGGGELQTRGERSYLFDFEPVTTAQLDEARKGQPVLIPDWPNNEFRALVHLDAYADRYLYVSREVDGSILSLLDETQETVQLYNQLESERGRLLFNFGLIYLGFALILVLAAVWLGLWFAERLSRPVGRLAGAAQRVGGGDLDVQVMEEEGDDEIAMLGRLFNQMTRQLKGQREALMEGHHQTELRRRLFDSVLSNVTAGVIGLDGEGRVDFVNRAAERLLDFPNGATGTTLAAAVPEFAALFDRLRDSAGSAVQEEIRLTRKGKLESLLVRMSVRSNDAGGLEGFVVAFDDVTDLVSAQRMAAWGDVARRIAHEIKNPLTPIQLSAERIKRKFASQVRDHEDLEQYTDVIIRQTNDLRRIVDEFSKFARMPEPDRRDCDLAELLRGAVLLQTNGQPSVHFVSDIPKTPVSMDLDPTMIGQALTNLIKNAGEAIETLHEKGAPPGHAPEIRIQMEADDTEAIIRIMDNGTGLPLDRARLFEPYVTTRDKGTGLGLPIVKKIIEEHGGTLALLDAPPFGGNAHPGAMAEIRLPRLVRRRPKTQGPSGQGG
ncbi:MAG: PAS domain-containing sensor histidine kinase [Tabrizicola sp.]|uniref:sensor histidine kinase NtrY-like n=1 Tax=Tabrizicola sp. TaxID=2005166 RepID=UPI00273236CB|nr:PAS domain-containing sensor histidine kinase [Tabrizicola sp.]MDP3264648.1 PAS domain-containing sensor histidine kinase [Tabrizicola sp.]MDP3647672.1 PAS domain-containing sensor histidine kinase [Paracoccaceae bacterium]MDZ4068409.1 PAS domain-containing sensor histidine kinase [Tabrizicola sp.]